MIKKKILVCVGTRPNLIKITGLEKAFSEYQNLEYLLLHTGQHYDSKMNEVFFEELAIKKPDFQFSLNQNSQVNIIAQIMNKFEAVCNQIKPDMVIVPGDVNSSFACAFVASRLGIPVAHIESGLRSSDMTMPEEVNRILIDHISALHFVTEPSGNENLLNEGFTKDTICYVGNSMIDSLVAFNHLIDKSSILEKHKLDKNDYGLFTFHRPINVDNQINLEKLINLIEEVSTQKKVVFPIHPRTLKNVSLFGLKEKFDSIKGLIKLEPQGYIDFLHLIKNAAFVVTDSGGVQEETTFLHIPCLTVRPNTERPVTITKGTNTLLDFDKKRIVAEINNILKSKYKTGTIPEKWDGKTSERIVQAINEYFIN